MNEPFNSFKLKRQHKFTNSSSSAAEICSFSSSLILPSEMQTLENQLYVKLPNSISQKKQISKHTLEKFKQKLALLAQNLETFPFIADPRTLISISTHEKLFRDLNLWDFANLKLDVEIRNDFLNEFIACYDPTERFSYVQGLRIYFSRADLSKALSLTSMNHTGANSDFNANEFGGAGKLFDILWRFILNKMVFLEDNAILPEEVANANSLVKAGSPNKVDWAGLIWSLIEKEMLHAPSSGRCYYASHLQRLMKFQKPMLFEEVEISKPSKATVDEDDCVLEEVHGGSDNDKCCTTLNLGIAVDSEVRKKEEDAKFMCSDNFNVGISQCDDKKERDADINNKEDNMVDNMCAEEQDNDEKIEDISKYDPVDINTLTKGHVDAGKNADGVTDIELGGFHERNNDGANEEGNGMNFELGGLNLKEECNGNMVNDVMDVEMGGLNEGNDGKTRNDDVGEDAFPNFDRLNSSDFIQVMETNSNPSLNRDLFSMSRRDVHDKSLNLEIGQGESQSFGNERKRCNDETNHFADGFQCKQFSRKKISKGRSDVHGMSMNLQIGQGGSLYFGNEHNRCNDETNHFAEEFQHKRFRSDQPWKETHAVTGFDQLSDEIQHVLGKLKMDILEKEHDFSNVSMQIEHVKGMVRQKDYIIRSMENNRMEAVRKRQLQAKRFDHDLKHLSNIVHGCKKALKDTQTRFAEYRIKYPVGGQKCNNEIDAEGSKQHLEEGKEMHRIIRSIITDSTETLLEKMENWEKLISMYSTKLVTFKEQLDALKESGAKAKNKALD